MSRLLGAFSGRRFVQPPPPPPATQGPNSTTSSSVDTSLSSIQKQNREGPSPAIEAAAASSLSTISSLTSVVPMSMSNLGVGGVGVIGGGGVGGTSGDGRNYNNQINVSQDSNTLSKASTVAALHNSNNLHHQTSVQQPRHISLLELPLYSGCGGGIAGIGSPCVVKFANARVFLRGKLRREDLWVRDGRVIDPASRFWEAATFSEFACDLIVDCKNAILCPGLIDVQINGGYGVDFSRTDLTHDQILLVAQKVLSAGVTSICPTLISSSKETYKDVLSVFRSLRSRLAEQNEKCVKSTCSADLQQSSPNHFKNLVCTAGARMIGMHLEGPFLCVDKKGAHPEKNILSPAKAAEMNLGYTQADAEMCREPLKVLSSVYGPVEWNSGEARIVTIAPELPGALQSVTALAQCGVVASIGHTSADIIQADRALTHGASMVTHLFNAMSAFKQRSPGVVGLLGRTPHGSSLTTSSSLNIINKSWGEGGATASTGVVIDSTNETHGSVLSSSAPAPSTSRTATASSKVTKAFEELERVEYVTPFTAIPFRKPELLKRVGEDNRSGNSDSITNHSIQNFHQFPQGPQDDDDDEDDVNTREYEFNLDEEETREDGDDDEDDDDNDGLIRPALARGASKVAADLLRRTETSHSSTSTESKSAANFRDSPVSPMLSSEIPKPNGGSATPLLGVGVMQRLQSSSVHSDGSTPPHGLSQSAVGGSSGSHGEGKGDFKKSFLRQAGLTNSPIPPKTRRNNNNNNSSNDNNIATSVSTKKKTRRNINGAVVTAVHERPYYGLIVDGVHNHPYSVNIAYETHPSGLILVTDAMAALGLPLGKHFLGEQEIEIFRGEKGGNYEGLHAALADNHNTLAGAIVPLDECVRNLLAFTQCPITHAIAAVTKHPSEMLRLNGIIGGLEVGCWADICVIDDSFHVLQTWLSGTLVYSSAT